MQQPRRAEGHDPRKLGFICCCDACGADSSSRRGSVAGDSPCPADSERRLTNHLIIHQSSIETATFGDPFFIHHVTRGWSTVRTTRTSLVDIQRGMARLVTKELRECLAYGEYASTLRSAA